MNYKVSCEGKKDLFYNQSELRTVMSQVIPADSLDLQVFIPLETKGRVSLVFRGIKFQIEKVA